MTAACPCLLKDALGNPQIRRENGRRLVTWTCGVCGDFNTETSEDAPQRNRNVLHGGGLGSGVGSSVLMDSTVGPS